MTNLIESTASITLDQNFDQHMALIKTGKHDDHVKAEAARLRPLFAAMSEYVEGVKPSNEVDVWDVWASSYCENNSSISVSANDIEQAFVKMAQESKSLILSDMPLTTLNKVVAFADSHCQSYWVYQGNNNTCFPDSDSFKKYRGWGFVQIHRDVDGEEASRVSMPVLGLTDKYNISSLFAQDSTTLRCLETIGRICNHDWVHHMTMTQVNNTVIYTPYNACNNLGADVRRVMGRVTPIDRYGVEDYEAFCVKTHAELLKTESARPLIKILHETVDELTESLHDLAKIVAHRGNIEKIDGYYAINHLALTTARILRRIEPIESPLTQHFIETSLKRTGPKNPHSIYTRDKSWGIGTKKSGSLLDQATKGLKKQYEASGLFTEIYEDNGFTQNIRTNVAELAGALKYHMVA